MGYRDTDSIDRVNHLFVHLHSDHTRRIFFKISKVNMTNARRDATLDVPLMQLEQGDEYTFVGLPAVSATRLYIIDVSEASEEEGGGLKLGGEDLLYMNWTIDFL